MRRHFDLTTSTPPTVLVAFQGWNDVTGAAFDAMDHLVKATGARLWADVDPEDYYDFQVNQPRIDVVDGERRVIWRTTEIFHTRLDAVGDVLIVKGIEPSFRWKAFLAELLDAIHASEPARVVVCGALGGDTPHTRPLPVTLTSPQPATREAYDAKTPTYVGPAGIVGILIDALGRSDVTTIAQWVVMPQYALGSPQPKVTWTMVQGLSRLLDVALPEGDLEEQARAWERGVSELVAQDGDMTSYVDTLEHSMNVTELPEASGDAIAEQFEQFLRRRDGDSRRGEQGPGGDTV